MKVRRKIVALGTALAMAFVMIASLVMVTDVKADDVPQQINAINLSVKAPDVNAEIKQNTQPIVSLPDGAKYKVTYGQYVKCYPSESQTGDPAGEIEFPFTVQENSDYYFEVYLAPDEGYEFAGTDTSLDATVKVDGEVGHELGYATKASVGIFVKVKTGSSGTDPSEDPSEEATVPVKDGYADQTVASGSAITIGFDTAITNFVNGTEQGLVYIDGTEVPSQYITATEGSTIITVAQEYLSQLAEGTHKMVVKFLDNTEGEASFTISSSAAASADGTTASSGTASSTAATTTKVTSPKTADVLPIAGIALVFVGATAIGVIAFRRKNS